MSRGAAFFDLDRTLLRGASGPLITEALECLLPGRRLPGQRVLSEKVWPRSSRLPDITTIVHPPTVRVRVGPPVRGLEGIESHRATRQIMDAIAALLPDEARRPASPTEAEILRATPPGGRS